MSEAEVPTACINYVEERTIRHYYRLPIDNSVEITPLVSSIEQTEAALQLYMGPELAEVESVIKKAKQSAKSGDELGAALRQIRKIDFSKNSNLHVDEQLGSAFLHLIGRRIGLNLANLHTVLYDGDAILIDAQNETIRTLPLDQTYALHGFPTGLSVIENNTNGKLKPCLGMKVPANNDTWLDIQIPLNKSISVFPCNRVPLTLLQETQE